jgi:hypothetical protein
MTIDCQTFLADLSGALTTYDRARVEDLCSDLVERITTSGQLCTPRDARRMLGLLRRKRLFVPMERIGEALIGGGERDAGVRADYVQALIDQGKLRPAEMELRQILSEHVGVGRPIPHKAMGLLGRVFKQRYVAMKNPPLGAAILQQAVDAYQQAFAVDPTEYWYGINLVALAARAQRDDVPLTRAPDPQELARTILAALGKKERENLASFDLATCAEAAIALGDSAAAFDWIRDYLLRQDTDAFEVSSTFRQLIEIWQLNDEVDPGRSILPLLRHAIATRSGGVVELGRAQMRAGLSAGTRTSFERAFGADSAKTLAWYRAMMDAARGVARICSRVEPDKGIGSGFLVRARDFLSGPTLAGLEKNELVLLTNAHVVSNQHPTALRPNVAAATFEALEEEKRQVNLREVLWESLELDAALVRLDSPVVPSPALAYDLASEQQPPTFDERVQRRVFVIGHAGGGALSISLQDSLQVGWSDPRVHYRTPTEPGNSGSPVFDDFWNVLALHHAACEGIPRPNGTGTYDANEGIWIQAIRAKAAGSPRG